MPEKLFVHVDVGHGEIVLAGQLLLDKARGRFKYAKTYLNHADAFALDPVNLPLSADVQEKARSREAPGIFGVLLDAGPDEWGRRQLSQTRVPPPVTHVEFLLTASGEGVGALHFTANVADVPRPPPRRPFESLSHLQHIAADIDAGRSIDRNLAPFFLQGSGIGGARPKTLIEHDGRHWIAKFSRAGDLVEMCRVEHASMLMARAAGIDVPDVEITSTGRGLVLLVERFDRSGAEQHHLISVASLINKFDITQYDESSMSYPGIFQLGKRICDGSDDLAEIVFRRMVFNVAIGNTDDHLRNHAFYKRANTRQYAITPAYDVVPHTGLQGSHAIALGEFGNTPTPDNLGAAAKRMGLNRTAARTIAAAVLTVCANWREHMHASGVSDADIAILERCTAMQRVVESFVG
ncbi:MAG: type II toxin-antitoxin system HipA family toxin [Gammaproteobacteria bacterium]|nr:type II toxin-antitoxin system HipA family toxin [Gammaproteobacteria bacterium]